MYFKNFHTRETEFWWHLWILMTSVIFDDICEFWRRLWKWNITSTFFICQSDSLVKVLISYLLGNLKNGELDNLTLTLYSVNFAWISLWIIYVYTECTSEVIWFQKVSAEIRWEIWWKRVKLYQTFIKHFGIMKI